MTEKTLTLTQEEKIEILKSWDPKGYIRTDASPFNFEIDGENGENGENGKDNYCHSCITDYLDRVDALMTHGINKIEQEKKEREKEQKSREELLVSVRSEMDRIEADLSNEKYSSKEEEDAMNERYEKLDIMGWELEGPLVKEDCYKMPLMPNTSGRPYNKNELRISPPIIFAVFCSSSYGHDMNDRNRCPYHGSVRREKDFVQSS